MIIVPPGFKIRAASKRTAAISSQWCKEAFEITISAKPLINGRLDASARTGRYPYFFANSKDFTATSTPINNLGFSAKFAKTFPGPHPKSTTILSE